MQRLNHVPALIMDPSKCRVPPVHYLATHARYQKITIASRAILNVNVYANFTSLVSAMNFWSSSQALQFLFTEEQLSQRRHDVYESLSSKVPVSLTETDHLRYVQYFGPILLENSMKLRFNRYQRYTALALMQRVYLARTVWEIPPPLAMICALFLVAKFIIPETLDSLLAALGYGTDFAEKFGPGESIAATEMEVLAALDFKLKVHLPFHQVIALCNGRAWEDKSAECQRVLFDLLRTDALLLHPPAHIAIAAVARVVGVEEALEAAQMGPVPEDMKEIIERILGLPGPDMSDEEVAEIEKRIAPELAVVRTLKREKEEEAAAENPTSLLPP
jgi:hypothetical protein